MSERLEREVSEILRMMVADHWHLKSDYRGFIYGKLEQALRDSGAPAEPGEREGET